MEDRVHIRGYLEDYDDLLDNLERWADARNLSVSVIKSAEKAREQGWLDTGKDDGEARIAVYHGLRGFVFEFSTSHNLKLERYTRTLRLFEWLAVASDDIALDRLLHQVASEEGRTTQQVAASFDFVTVGQAVSRLNGFVELGVDLFQIAFPYRHEAESVRLMAEHVLPKLQ